MKQHISIITLTVENLTQEKNFYEQLGWQRAEKNTEEGIVFFNLNSMVLALYPCNSAEKEIGQKFSEPANNKQSITLARNEASEKEVDLVIDLATKAGANIVVKAKKTFWGGYSGYFSTPAGYLWEVAHNPFAALDKDGNFQI